MTAPIYPRLEAAKAGAAAELAAALAAVQAELPTVTKNRTADVIGKDGRRLYAYSYADLADVSAAIMPILGKHGLAFTALPGHIEGGKFGLRYYLMHASGASLEGFYEIADQGGMQMVGGRITYARRYCLCAVTGVAAEEDVDARGDGQTRRPRQHPSDGEQEPTRTAQRKPRAKDASPAETAKDAPVSTPPRSAGEALPPLPGEEETPPGEAADAAPGEPDERDYDSPETATEAQLKAIATITKKAFGLTDEQSREVCAHIAGHEVTTRTVLSKNNARAVIDTLSHWQRNAKTAGMEPRDYLYARMEAEEAAREQDAAEGGESGE